MSRVRPHHFSVGTPDPAAATASPIDDLLQLVRVWLIFAAACCALAGLLAFFCPSFFTLFR